MIHTLSIDGYRGFHRFEMSQLGRVNLLVGKNNSGKTSVLEAMYLLAAAGDPSALWRVLTRRGERIDSDSVGRGDREPEYDVSHLFSGHELKLGSAISLTTRNGSPERSISFRVIEPKSEQDNQDHYEITGERPVRLALVMQGSPKPIPALLPLTRQGGLRSDILEGPRRLRRDRTDIKPAQYVATESLSVTELTAMWNEIVLTDSEELVLSALRFLEASIERIAAVSPSAYYGFGGARGGFKVKLNGVQAPIPIGSLGDGTWRMLALAIALVRSKDGVLLVDEIDTGLHYSIMQEMWNLVVNTARSFNIQVFATTHSYDCVQSLSELCRQLPDRDESVTIQRIEAGRRRAVRFTEAEIRIASARQIEIR